jgi:hypothetical protein
MRSRRVQALVVLLLFGVVKLPIEQVVSAKMKEARMLQGSLDLGLWENLGQMGFAASLGGLRALVAGVTYMQAYVAFEDIEWAKVDSLFQLTSRLQPHDVSYWDEGAWHMAYNAASNYLHSDRVEPIMRGKLYHAHIERGIRILEDGLRYNPDNVRLLSRLGDIYSKRKLDPVQAGETYEKVSTFEGLERYGRFAAYEYLKTTDRELWKRSYELLMASYKRDGKKFPSVIDGIKELEKRLGIPFMQWIPEKGSGRGVVAPVQPMDLPATR